MFKASVIFSSLTYGIPAFLSSSTLDVITGDMDFSAFHELRQELKMPAV